MIRSKLRSNAQEHREGAHVNEAKAEEAKTRAAESDD